MILPNKKVMIPHRVGDKAMGENFDAVWNDVQSRLVAGTTIRVWSYANDYGLNKTFRVEEIEPGAITVSSSGTTLPRRVSRGDFAKVHSRWADYCVGRFPRHLLRDLSQNSTYIIGIFRWRETELAPITSRVR